MKRRDWMIGVSLCAVSSVGSAQQFVRIGSGLAGSYPVFGAKVAELFNKHVPGIKASTFAGPTEQSLVKLQRGEAEVVLTYTFEAESTYQGRGELQGNTRRDYDDRGRFTGRAETQGRTTNYYDDRGRKDWRSEKR